MKERERQEQIERRIPVGRSALALLAGEVSCRLHTYTHRLKVQAHVLYLNSSLFFSSPFLLNRSLLSLEGGGIKRSRGEEASSIVSLQRPYSSAADIDLCQEDPSCWFRQAVNWKRCLKCWSGPWPVERWFCLFAILLSTTSQRKLFCPNLLTRRKGTKKRWSLGFESHSWGHTMLWPLWLFDTDIWTWWSKGWKELKAYFFQLSLNRQTFFATAHNSQRQQSLNLPTTWICMISPLSSLPSELYFFFHPETCRVVFDWPWHLKRSLNKKKKKRKLFMTTGELSSQQSKNGILKGAQRLHF